MWLVWPLNNLMFLSYITLAVALSLSVIAAYYSIAGLTAIFAAAVIPIIVMGSILELGKVVITLWLHEYWSRCRWLMKMYLVPAVAVLMLITSMGIFGFLSKAHSDQSLVGGDVQARIAIYDEKIKTEKENIDTARRALKQMDEGVDQVLGRSTSETGANRAVALRRSQQKERGRLLAEISQSQKSITELNETRAPIAAEIRKVEAEVGPLKYIAKLIYGDNPDANLLEKAVTWVIIIIVAVFDPLAIMMLLAATESMKWERQRVFELLRLAPAKEPEPDPTPEPDLEPEPVVQDSHPTGWMFTPGAPTPPVPEKSTIGQHPYLLEPFVHFKDLEPMVHKPELAADCDDDEDDDPEIKAAIKQWKLNNPWDTIKHQRNMLARGEINELPWIQYLHNPTSSFGVEFPLNPSKGDSFVRTDRIPSVLYKFNNRRWIEVDKNTTDNYTYDTAYIDYLIEMIGKGTYDADLLTAAEQEQIAIRLQTNPTTNT
jgi:hypothetical protein